MRGPLLLLLGILSIAAFGAATVRAAPAIVPAPSATAKESLPSMAELRELFKAQKYQDVLKQIQRVLQLKGDAAKPYDRYDLLCLRGECFLRIKSMPLAAEAFDDAAETAKDDAKKQGVAKGTAVLIRRAKQIGYVPRLAKPEKGKPAPAPPKPMQIIEEADRKAAFATLLADERAVVAPKVESAQKGTSLPSIIEVARMLGDLQAVEIAATGKGDQTKAMTTDLAAQSHDLIATALDSMNEAVEAAWDHASTETWEVDQYGRPGRMIGRIGLFGPGEQNVRFAMAQTQLLAPAAAELWKVTNSDKLKRDAEIAAKLYDRAVYILEYPYNQRRASRTNAGPAPRAR